MTIQGFGQPASPQTVGPAANGAVPSATPVTLAQSAPTVFPISLPAPGLPASGSAPPTVPIFGSDTPYSLDPRQGSDERALQALQRPSAQRFIATLEAPDRAAFGRLQPAQQAQVVAMCDILNNTGDNMVLSLLRRGVLTQRSSDGQTTLDHLTRLMNGPVSLPAHPTQTPDRYRLAQFSALLTNIHQPAAMAQMGKGTCGASSVLQEFARATPAEYARVACELLSEPNAESNLGGIRLHRHPETNQHNPDDARPMLDRVMASAFMQAVTPLDAYSDVEDRHHGGAVIDGVISLARLFNSQAGSGMTGAGVARLTDAIRSYQHGGDMPQGVMTSGHIATIVDGGFFMGVHREQLVQGVAAELRRQSDAGQTPPSVRVSLDWANSWHWVAVNRMTQDRVYITNPHGNLWDRVYQQDAQGHWPEIRFDDTNRQWYVEAPYPGSGPNPVRFYRDGTQSLPRRIFDDNVDWVVASQDITAHFGRADQMEWFMRQEPGHF